MEALSPAERALGSIRQDVFLLGLASTVRTATPSFLEAMGQDGTHCLRAHVLSEALRHFGPAFRLPAVYRDQPLHMAWFVPALKQYPSLMLWEVNRQISDEHDGLDWSLASLGVHLPAAGVAQSMHWRHDHRKKTFGNPPRWNTVWDSEESLMHALEHMLMRSVVWHEQVEPWCKQNSLDNAWSSNALAPAELVRL